MQKRINRQVCGMVWCMVVLAGALSGWAADANVKICLAGASTVQTYKPGEDIAGWGQVLGMYFNDHVIIENHAIGGRSTKTFRSEGRWTKLLASKPDFILIHFGHNDSHGKGKPESTDAATDYKDYLRAYIDEARSGGATPILVTPVHRRSFDKTGQPSEELLPYAVAMKEVAAEKQAIVVDLHALSGELLEKLGEAGALDLYRNATDRSHFSTKGAETVAGMIVADLKRQDSPLKAYMREVPVRTTPRLTAAAAVPPKACVHVSGKEAGVALAFEGGSTGVSGAFADWLKTEKDKRLIVTLPAPDEWAMAKFSFTPRTSGKVMLILMSTSNRDGDAVCYDTIAAEGATILNGDFEAVDASGRVANWVVLGAPIYDAASGAAHSGKAFVKCTGANRFNQTLRVEEGKTVSLTLWTRTDKRETKIEGY